MRWSQNMHMLKSKMDLMPLLLLKWPYIINMVQGFLAMNETLFKLLTTVLLPTFFFSTTNMLSGDVFENLPQKFDALLH